MVQVNASYFHKLPLDDLDDDRLIFVSIKKQK